MAELDLFCETFTNFRPCAQMHYVVRVSTDQFLVDRIMILEITLHVMYFIGITQLLCDVLSKKSRRTSEEYFHQNIYRVLGTNKYFYGPHRN